MYATHRTPPKKAPCGVCHSPDQTELAGPAQASKVRRSIGEGESGKSPNLPSSPKKTTVSAAGPTRTKAKTAVAETSRKTPVDVSGSPPPKPTYISRVAEARACLNKAKLHLSSSRNTKTEIKEGVIASLDRLYQLVKEAEAEKAGGSQSGERGDKRVEDPIHPPPSTQPALRIEDDGFRRLEEHSELMRENTRKMEELSAVLLKHQTVLGDASYASVAAAMPSNNHSLEHMEHMEELIGEVKQLRQATNDTAKQVASMKEGSPSYADVVSKPGRYTPIKTQATHSIIVSSDIEKDTSDEVLGKVRETLDAKTSGFQVQRVRKVKNQKVVLSCSTKGEVEKMTAKLKENQNLRVEEAKNKDPLVILKNVLSYNTDEDIIASLGNQNASVLGGLSKEDSKAMVKYRRRARNQHENHVVLQVSPRMWQRLTSAGKVHIDLQHVVVEDQSPLMQCTRCLGYGHGRKMCKETVDLCSFCGGEHLRAACPNYAAGETPSCRNCKAAKFPETGHNAFDGECPIRKRWDAIARASVAYC